MTTMQESDRIAISSNQATSWSRKDLLDTDTLTTEEIELIMLTADAMAEVRSRPISKVATLRGAVVVTLFYEQSTRTRASFEVAGKSLGADVINISASGSSVEKGESLVDTIHTLEAIGADLLVMRHGSSGAPYLAARETASCVINGGDGTHAHPTQALLDLYTVRSHLGDLQDRKVAIVGDVLHSRVARSNIWTLLASGASITLCGPATLLPKNGSFGDDARVTVTPHLDEAIDGADVVMALRLQKERQQVGLIPSLRDYIRSYQITSDRLRAANPNVLVMHPGPVNEGVEIAPEVARGVKSAIEAQVGNGVAVRMALLYLMLAAARR